MRTVILCCWLTLFLLMQHAVAADMQEIELTDGSTVVAEVLSLADGVYTLKSTTLGTVRIESKRVRAIRAKQSPGRGGPEQAGGNAAVSSLQEKMLNDGDIMALIQSLQNDPDFQNILEDPEIMKALNAGDTDALTANPRFMKLLNNKTVQAIQKKVK